LVKIIFLTSRFPYPLEKGDKLRAFRHLEALSTVHEVHLVSLSHVNVEEEQRQVVQKFCKTITIHRLSWWDTFLGILWAFLHSKPYSVGYFFSASIKRKIERDIQGKNPDVVYCQLVRMAPYAQDSKFFKFIDYMDSFSLIAERRSRSAGIFARLFFSIESRRLKQYEKSIYPKFDRHIFISQSDRDQILDNVAESWIISNGIDTVYFDPRKFEIQKEFDIAFVGNMGYHPNIMAAIWLVKNVLPLLPTDTKVLIAGARPSAMVRNLASNQVKVSGYVEDIRSSYASSRIFMAPIFFGAGQQNKILEAMSMEVPCITSSQVNNAIGAKSGDSIMIADSAEEFATAYQQLTNVLFNRKIGTQGRKFVENQYLWEKVNKDLLSVFS